MNLASNKSCPSIYHSPQVRKTLIDEIAREAKFCSLAYANLSVFVGVLFCFSGLSPLATIYYVSTTFCVYILTAVVGGLYRITRSNKVLMGSVMVSVIVNEVALSSIILFDIIASERASTLSGMVIVISISFISVHLCARFTLPLLISKFLTVVLCCLYLVYEPTQIISVTEALASLLVALFIMQATGYWIILRRRNEIVLQQQLQEMNQLTDMHNQQLKLALEENEATQFQLKQEYKLRQKLISHVGHDLRQPIIAASYMLRELEKTNTSNASSTLISDTTECINSASVMIEDIVQYTHFDNIEIEVLPEWVDIGDLLELLVREYTGRAGYADCYIHSAPTSVTVFIDINLLKRILRNLILNVIKHSDATKLLLGVRRRITGVEIWVADNGIGLNGTNGESTITYQPSSQAGLGLGIKISQQLATACGTSLTHLSRSGEGTVFRLEIPSDLVRFD